MVTSKEREVLDLLAEGPRLRSQLLHGRKQPFLRAYRKLVAGSSVVESGSGAKGDPVYAGLPGTQFPERRRYLGVRKADVAMLVRSGMTRQEAVEKLSHAAATGESEIASVVQAAMDKMLHEGLDPWAYLKYPNGEKERE